MTTITLGFLDHATGQLVLDAEQPLADQARRDLAGLVAPTEMGCANPTVELKFPASQPTGATIQVSGYWHNSLWEGPGRRSVVRVQGCPIRCKGCWVPETWDMAAGQQVDVAVVAETLLDAGVARDGVTILGGEPFAQPESLWSLVCALRELEPDVHITVYSGFTLQTLLRRNQLATNEVLATINVLIDGPYVAAMADSAGPWTGSGNQRVHYLR